MPVLACFEVSATQVIQPIGKQTFEFYVFRLIRKFLFNHTDMKMYIFSQIFEHTAVLYIGF